MRTHITEAMAEKMVDAQVMAQLSTDSAYRNASSAEEQGKREDEIVTETWAALEDRYEIA